MKIVITGFDPFAGERINPAWQAVSALPDQRGKAQLSKLQLPTIFNQSAEKLFSCLEAQQPDAVICVGQAGGRYEFSLERVAINLDDARIPDNAGQQPVDTPVYPDGENALFTSLPVKAIVMELKKAGIPAVVSNTAGTFVCNHVMYSLLYYINKHHLAMRGGFIHLPYLPEQVVDKPATPYMELSRIIHGLEITIDALCHYSQDIRLAAGKEC